MSRSKINDSKNVKYVQANVFAVDQFKEAMNELK